MGRMKQYASTADRVAAWRERERQKAAEAERLRMEAERVRRAREAAVSQAAAGVVADLLGGCLSRDCVAERYPDDPDMAGEVATALRRIMAQYERQASGRW